MRYDDASQAGSTAADTSPVARADVDVLPAGSFGPATGNTITGSGTATGASGADTVGDAPGQIVQVQGAGGPAAPSGGNFQATGQYGVLSMDAQGNFNYVRNAGTPDGVQDVFGYTLADADGQQSSSTLTINIGQIASASGQVIPGVVNLPPGVELSDIRVSGRDLIITLPDGSQMVIPGGAVFVPQLVIGDVQVPASNLAALLVSSEPQPAAGQLQSSGGNFATDVPPLDPGVPLGDLIPPTELSFPEPIFEEIGQFVDREPEITIEPDGQPASVAAVDEVFEAGLPTRNGGEPEGSGEEAAAGANGDPSEATAGTIHFVAEDGLQSLTIQGADGPVVITSDSVGTVIHGAQGDLTITGVNFGAGTVTYSYLLLDNTNPGGDGISDPFTVVVTDSDDDTATATLTINIVDDRPDARDDTDALTQGQNSTDGNVMTSVNTTNSPAGRDTVGADNATVTAVHASNTGTFTSVTAGGVTIPGLFGDLTINSNGTYTYTRTGDAGGTEVFTYRLTDGDGDTDDATLTIIVPPDIPPQGGDTLALEVDDDALPTGNNAASDDEVDSGQLTFTAGSDPLTSFRFSADVSGLGGGLTWVRVSDVLIEGRDGGDLIVSLQLSAPASIAGGTSGNVTITATLHDNFDSHPGINVDDLQALGSVQVIASEADPTDFATGTVSVGVSDDVPIAGTPDASELPVLIVDESPLAEDGDNSDSADFSFAFGGASIGADQPGTETFQLVLSTEGAASGLFALDPSDTETAIDPLGQGASITLHQVNDTTVEGRVGATVYFTITVVESGVNAGEVTLTRTPGLNLWHDDTTNHDDPEILTAALNTLQLQQTVTDVDNDTDTALLDLSAGVFRFEDDGPRADNPTGVTLEQLIVDESPLAEDGDNQDSANFATAFAGFFDHGTDGPGDETYQLVLNTEGAASGLFALDPSDTETVIDPLGQGASITLHQVSDTLIEGRVGATVYFTITVAETGVNAGEVTLTRTPGLNLWHDDTTNHDDPEILSAVANTLQLQQTVIDADGDTDTAVIDLSSGVFRFEDDGPRADNPTGVTLEQLIVDESPLADDGDNQDSANFATAFAGFFDHGTDGPGDETYQLVLNTEGAASGLFALDPSDTETVIDPLGRGASITLHQVNSTTVEGRVGATVYFTITVAETGVNAGTVTLTRTPGLNLWHDDTTNHDDPEILSAVANTLQLQQTVIDADGDTDTAVIDLSSGVFRFEDDGPDADPDTNTVEEGGSLNVNAASGVLANDGFGTDGPGTIQGVAAGSNTSSPVSGNVGVPIVTALGTLTLNANGSYTYTSTDGAVPPGGATDTFVYTIRDADGDTSTVTLTITLTDDSGPVGGDTLALEVDDDALSDGNNAASDDEVDAGTLTFTAGADALTSFAFAAGTGTLDAGLTWTRVSDTLIEGRDGATLIVSLTLTGPAGGTIAAGATGDVTITATLHNNYDSHPVFTADDLQALGSVTVVASEADPADFATGTVSVSVSDDIPLNNGTTLTPPTVHEDALSDGNSEGGQTVNATITVAQLLTLVDDGADNPLVIGFNAAIDGTATGLFQGGVSIVWDVVSATQVRGLVGDNPANVVFTLTRSGDNYNFVLLDNIDHDNDASLLTGEGDAFNETLSLANVFTATDVDNDSVIINAGASINIQNDVPVNNGTTLTAPTVHEDALNNANSVGNSEGGQTVNATITVASLLTLVDDGADNPVAIGFNAAIDGTATGLFQGGVSIVWDVVSATQVRGLVGDNPANVVFTLTRSGDNYNFVLLDNIDHDNDASLLTGEGDAFNETLSLASVFTATDTDGDRVIIDAGASINIQNDVPTLGTIDDGTANNTPAAAHSFGDLNFSIGADEPATVTNITLSTTATSGGRPIVTQFDSATGVLTGYQDVGPAGYDAGDTTVVFTLTVDPDAGTSGQWEFDLVTPLDTVVTPVDIGGSSSFGAGPTPDGQILTDGADPPATPTPLSVVSGYNTTGSFDFTAWFGGGLTSPMIAAQDVNGSTAGWGVDDNNFNTDNVNGEELMFFDFGAQALSNPDGAGGYEPPAGTTLPNISFATFQFISYDSGAPGNDGDDIAYVVHYTDGSVDFGFIPEVNIDGAEWTFTADAGKFIADIQFYSGANPDGSPQDLGPGKIDLVRVGVNQTSINKDLDFTVTLSDSDGDSVQGSFTINVADGNTPSTLSLAATSFSFESSDTSFLAANENYEQQKAFSSGTNTVLMGALAAAGLSIDPLAAQTSPGSDTDGDSASFSVSGTDSSVGSASDASGNGAAPDSQLQPAQGDALDQQSAQSNTDAASDDANPAADTAPAEQPAELLQGTDAPSSDDASATAPATADAIVMPSADQLIAAALTQPATVPESSGVAGDGVQHNQIVSQVLIDSLNGGDGSNVEALINTLPASGDAQSGLDALASHGDAGVSIGDMGVFAGFATDAGMHMVDLTMHQDAAPASA